ncbi:uncharacterized protein LOC143627385 [Bidens hawaiensis]|uniref:uncharacterized protein LOC143627385 n=1 Tax=Bidens hawaiensis TaxID=980011 RepID=UPI00404A7E7B
MDSCMDYIYGADLVGGMVNGVLDCEVLDDDGLDCDELVEILGLPEVMEVNEVSCENEAGPVEKPALLELKVLLLHLEYAYLGRFNVFSKLTEEQKLKLLEVLKLCKGKIAWRLLDIHGISPAYCTHQILMEDVYKPVVQPQRHLDPNMQEVVKKEVLKLMDADMIYPILIALEDQEKTTLHDLMAHLRTIHNLEKMSKICIETKLMLNWEKCHFMVTEGIFLGHKISRDVIKVDRAKIDTISRLPPPTNVKAIRSFIGHVEFYRRFIKDFSKITSSMTRLLEKDFPFLFDEESFKAFKYLKEKLVSALILSSPNWSLPFELMCDACDYVVEVFLEQRDQGVENVAADRLSRLDDPKREEMREKEIGATFPHELIDFVAAESKGMTMQQKKKFFRDVNTYVWDDLFLFKIGGDRILRTCVTREEGLDILRHVHEGLTGGHHGSHATTQKWVEAQALATNDARVVVKFLKRLFTHFGTPRAIISDWGIHFCNTFVEKALACYGVTHRASTSYHPHTNGKVKNANRGVKRILKKTVGVSRKD